MTFVHGVRLASTRSTDAGISRPPNDPSPRAASVRRAIRSAVGLAARHFKASGPVVELGACYQPGYAWLSDLRPLFPGREYVGCDIRRGPGVDRIEDAEHLAFSDGSTGTMIMCEILEHLPNPTRALAEARRVLRPDGLLLISVPFNFRLHGFPHDYWRFTAAGMWQLMADFEAKAVWAVGPRVKPAFIFAVARTVADATFEGQRQSFERELETLYRERRLRGLSSVLKERARDLFGVLLGRGELGVRFFEPSQPGGYQRDD